jgi:hypothetical protein
MRVSFNYPTYTGNTIVIVKLINGTFTGKRITLDVNPTGTFVKELIANDSTQNKLIEDHLVYQVSTKGKEVGELEIRRINRMVGDVMTRRCQFWLDVVHQNKHLSIQIQFKTKEIVKEERVVDIAFENVAINNIFYKDKPLEPRDFKVKIKAMN